MTTKTSRVLFGDLCRDVKFNITMLSLVTIAKYLAGPYNNFEIQSCQSGRCVQVSLKKEDVASMFREAARLWQENVSELGEIDSRFGDGDHGVAMGKIAAYTLSRLDEWLAANDESIKSFIENLASGVMSVGGGSAGPLYGTLIEGMSAPLSNETEIYVGTLKAMLSGSRDALFEVTKARRGDKTMMDAVIPAAEAAEATDGGISAILAAAAEAAKEGAESTENMVSKFGRARSYGDATIGTKDAGALSASLFYIGLNKAVNCI
jgi:dihydroxyacetone kinase-like protein